MEIISENIQSKTGDQTEIEARDEEPAMLSNSLVKLRPFVDRYFTKYYKKIDSITTPGLSNNQYAFVHFNKLFMTGITKDHEIVTQRLKVKKINFVGLVEGGSLAVRGKGKKGGIKVKTGKKFAEILTEDGKKFPLIGLMDGFVIEINEAIEQDPNILLDSPESKGYIALINSGLKIERYLANLIPEAQYQSSLTNEGQAQGKSTAIEEENQ